MAVAWVQLKDREAATLAALHGIAGAVKALAEPVPAA